MNLSSETLIFQGSLELSLNWFFRKLKKKTKPKKTKEKNTQNPHKKQTTNKKPNKIKYFTHASNFCGFFPLKSDSCLYFVYKPTFSRQVGYKNLISEVGCCVLKLPQDEVKNGKYNLQRSEK